MHSPYQASENARRCATAKTSTDVLCSVTATRTHRVTTACFAIDRLACSTTMLTLCLIGISTFTQ